MLPVYSPHSHADFQEFFVSNFLKYYPDPFSLSRQTWKVIVQFWHMDLSQTELILMDSYSKMGSMPRQPSSMLRSYLLSLKLKITSVTDWVSKLKECPLYAILSGFSPGDVPDIGTFYDFFWHMWNSDKKHLSTQLRYKKKKTPNGRKHGDKTPNIEDTAAFRFIRFFKKHPLPDSSGSPLSLIFRLYKQQFLDFSVSFGLINPSSLALAGDGTPARTMARPRYKKACKCSEKGILHCNCKRKFSQPDCNIRWDSSRDCYFNGYHLYMFVASDSPYGRVVHTPTKDNPRLFNIPSRNSEEWDKEYDRRTSVERSNKREKEDYKLEDGRHRSSMMWYCRLYGIMMLQHLDAWGMPSVKAFQTVLSSNA